MKAAHVAFCLEQQYGHIIPTLGIALELISRGHRVSYAVTARFSELTRKIRAESKIINLRDTRRSIISKVFKDDDCFNYRIDDAQVNIVLKQLSDEKTPETLSQLETVYRDDRPDVVIHDDVSDTAARTLAVAWGIPKIRLLTQYLEQDSAAEHLDFSEDEVILLTVPRFFQRNIEQFDSDSRFHFVGFVPEGRTQAFDPWIPQEHRSAPVLISGTTGALQQVDFYKTAIEAFRDQPWDVVLSVSGVLDESSALHPSQIAEVPRHMQINYTAGNFAILRSARLFIGQGGQGASLEAIYCAVPQIVVPPSPYHYSVAKRVCELGLGTCLPLAEMSNDRLLNQAVATLNNRDILQKVMEASRQMCMHPAAVLAADAIDAHMHA